MAYFYSLAVDCGSEAAASACADHFLSPGAMPADIPVDLSVRQASDDNAWWTVIVPSDESTSGVISAEVRQSLSAAGDALLDRLRSAPAFRFAIIGVEAEQAISLGEFDATLGADPTLAERYHGLVVADELLDRLASPTGFEPFAPGYHWIPYRGERFDPAG